MWNIQQVVDISLDIIGISIFTRIDGDFLLLSSSESEAMSNRKSMGLLSWFQWGFARAVLASAEGCACACLGQVFLVL